MIEGGGSIAARTADEAIQEAAPHLAALHESIDSLDESSRETALEKLLDIAIAHTGSDSSPFACETPPSAEKDVVSIQESRLLVQQLVALQQREEPEADEVAVADCMESLERLEPQSTALRNAGVVTALVETLPVLRGAALVRFCMALARLVRAEPRHRESACAAGGEKQARAAHGRALNEEDEDVRLAAEALLFALAFERADEPSAAKLTPQAKDAAEPDDAVLALTAAFERQRLQADIDQRAGGVTSVGKPPRQRGARTAMPAPKTEVEAEYSATGNTSIAGGCVLRGAGCEGACSRPMPGCGHLVLCEVCEMTCELLGEPMTRHGDSDLTAVDDSRPNELSALWCPVCRGASSASVGGEQQVEEEDAPCALADAADGDDAEITDGDPMAVEEMHTEDEESNGRGILDDEVGTLV